MKPTVKYRTFRSDDTSKPLCGPITLEITGLAFNRSGAAFEARAPKVSVNRTGEVYTVVRFPMLRGFL